MATIMAGLRPSTSGVSFTARPALRTPSRSGVSKSVDVLRVKDENELKVSADMSVIEVEGLLRKKVSSVGRELQLAFQNYDTNQTLSVTKGEFRRVLETYCCPLTSQQFEGILAKVSTSPDGTVRYCDFLDKFSAGLSVKHATDLSKSTNHLKSIESGHQFIRTDSPKQLNTDMIEKMLRDKIQKNMKNVIKGLRLYDYNRDGHIQKHELRKVLENYCFRMNDEQFEKLYQRYDFHHRGLLNYKDFLYRLGISVEEKNKPRLNNDSVHAMMTWQEFQKQYAENNHNRKGAPLVRPDESMLAGMSLHEIEVEFRKQMRANYANLKRMFIAMDRHLDGFISLEDLKSVLFQFTLPMSDQLFTSLMDRFQIKASGKISWEFFLEKFQDPQAAGNGQTIPIKPGHKYFPNMGVDEKADLRDLLRVLDNHVQSHFASYKHAFLQLDANREGKISRKELRKMMNRFKFDISDAQFKELMILLDPQHTNVISYQHFLNLFEQRETKEGHKWLRSVHRYNDQPKPAVLAWQTVEAILCSKVEDNWKHLAADLVACDSKETRKVTPKEMRKVLEKYSLPVSDQHFENMVSRVKDQADGKISYVEFLQNLGVTVSPGDLEGVSTQIHNNNIKSETKRLNDQWDRQEAADQYAGDKTSLMSVDEIIVRIKDRMAQHKTSMRKAFQSYDTSGKGKIKKKDFRQVMANFGMHMSDEQFKDLCARLAFHNGHMTYIDFIDNFEDPRHSGPAEQLQKGSNHIVNKIRGDERGLTAIEVEAKLRSKLRHNFEDLRGAFYKFDEGHNGFLTKTSFRRMLDSFMCNTSDAEFDKLCKGLGLTNKSRISYNDFLEKFEVRETEEGHKWLKSDHRWNDTKDPECMSAEQAHEELKTKAHQQYKDIAVAFRTIDSNGKGILTRKDLQDTLQRFILPINKQEFNRLWTRYDPEGKGFVTHPDFVYHLTGLDFTPGDEAGTSRKIVEGSYRNLERHHRDQQAKHEQITVAQANKSVTLSLHDVFQQLRDRIRDQHKDYHSAFKAYDHKKRGYLTTSDIQKLLVDLNYFLDDDQFYDLLQWLGMSAPKSKLNYESFVLLFEEGRPEHYASEQPDVYLPGLTNGHLSPDEAIEKLRAKVIANKELLQKAFQAFDRDYTGRMKCTDFRRVLDNFCFKLSNKQFKELTQALTVFSDGTLDYLSFLDSFTGSTITDAARWMQQLQERLSVQTPIATSTEDLQQLLAEKVAANFHTLARAFAECDYARIGVLGRDEFRDILNKHTQRFNDEQFEKLWTTLAVNEFNNVDYREFLQAYCAKGTAHNRNISRAGSRPATSASFRPGSQMSRPMSRISAISGGIPQRSVTPLVNAESAENKLRHAVYRNWKNIQKYCRECDSGGSGQIHPEDFKSVIRRYAVDLSEDDIEKVLIKYDIKENGLFCYNDFLRHFVLTMKSHEGSSSSLLARKKLESPKIQPLQEEESSTTEDALLRVKQCVQDHWKEMRRDFRAVDPDGLGLVSALEFKQVLRNYSVNISEDEFYRIVSLYDKSVAGQINYNDFIRSALKGA